MDLSEQVKKEIADQVNKSIAGTLSNLNKSLELFSLPMTSQFRMLLWTGTANSTALTPAFDIANYRNRYIVIKSLRIVPYYSQVAGGVDIWLDDGATDTVEVISQNSRINRLFDRFTAQGTVVNFTINNTILPIMNEVATIGFPLDTIVDNIYYKFPAPVSSMTMSVLATVIDNLQTNGSSNPSVKVVVECYLL